MNIRQCRFCRFLLIWIVLFLAYDSIVPNMVCSDDRSSSVRLPSTLSPTLKEDVQFLKEETVVTAMRYEQPISEAPSNVYVITAEDIRRSGAIDVPTILRRVPGMEVMQMTGAEFNVSVRGDNQTAANKLLVLVDGRSIYLDAQGTVNWKALPVTITDIKQIEVLKGPASAVHGFNAFDGVVNIITKRPDEMKGFRTQVGVGEFGTLSSSASFGGQVGPLGVKVSGGHDQTAQWSDEDALAYRSYTLNVQSRYDWGHDLVGILNGGVVDVNRFDGPVTETVTSTLDSTDGYVQLGLEHPSFFVRAFWRGVHSDNEVRPFPSLQPFLSIADSSGSSMNQAVLNTYDLEAQHNVRLLESHVLIYGINYRHNTISSNFLDRFRAENRLGLFVQDEWKPTPALTTNVSFRLDLNTFINPTYSPRVALLYRPWPNHTFRVTGALAYRPPTLVETFTDNRVTTSLPLPIPSVVVTLQGSQNLAPEQIISYELGYQGWFFDHRLRLRTDLFFHHISDLIRPAGAIGNRAVFENGGEADIYGGESGIEFWATSWLSGFFNYAYQEIGQTFIGTDRRAVPRFKINGGIRGHWESGLNLELAIHYVGATKFPIALTFNNLSPFGVMPPATRVGSYTLLNVWGAYRFWDDRAELALSVFNALNDRHREHPLGDTIGSRVLGWLTVQL